jgi:hypothetical protein
MALSTIANEFVQGLYLRYPSEEIQNAISTKLYDENQLSGFLNTFQLKEQDYFIEKLLNHSVTVFIYNPVTKNYERVHNTVPFVPVASTTYNRDTQFNQLYHHGKRGDKKPLEKSIYQKNYTADHWLAEYTYTYSPCFSS